MTSLSLIILILLLMGILIFILVAVRKRGKVPINAPACEQRSMVKRDAAEADSSPNPSMPELVGLAQIEAFFLNLFRCQIGAPPEAPGLMSSTPEKHNRPGRIYKLSVQHKGEWASRHMTIGPIGQVTHCKSQCFYVIFDTHMVVKIPPAPIRNFTDYIGRIRLESTIVNKLAPLLCIIPAPSVVLNRIHQFPGIEAVRADGSEEKYIRFLETAPEHRKYLKIGDAFAFFMDLSRHFFLSHVLSELHRVEDEIRSIIASDASLLLQGYDFETKYGPQNASICADIQKLFSRFESELTRSRIPAEDQLLFGDKHKREWFFAHLGNEPISPSESSVLTKVGLSEVTRTLESTVPLNGKTVATYKQLVSDYGSRIIFNRNRSQLSAMATNLLHLLMWLNERRISLRDLKPDNLLIAGNTDNYPLFLLSADDYRIGLIDLETAVDFDPPGNQLPLQPRLGGTPAYATPSHFTLNPLLVSLYGELPSGLPLILHLQDWYAMVAIIFEVVTGHRLFVQTGSELLRIIQLFQRARAQQMAMRELYLSANAEFWTKARKEFAQKTEKYAYRLDNIEVPLPSAFTRALSTDLHPSAQPVAEPTRAPRETLTVRALLSRMFSHICEVMDQPALPPRTPDSVAVETEGASGYPESETQSIGYTLSCELPMDRPDSKSTPLSRVGTDSDFTGCNSVSGSGPPLSRKSVG